MVNTRRTQFDRNTENVTQVADKGKADKKSKEYLKDSKHKMVNSKEKTLNAEEKMEFKEAEKNLNEAVDQIRDDFNLTSIADKNVEVPSDTENLPCQKTVEKLSPTGGIINEMKPNMVKDTKVEKKIDNVKTVVGEKVDEAHKKAEECFDEAHQKMMESKEKQFEACRKVDECHTYKRSEARLNQAEEEILEAKNVIDDGETARKKAKIDAKFEKEIEKAKQAVSGKAEECNMKANQYFEESRQKQAEAKGKMLEGGKQLDEIDQFNNAQVKLDEAKHQMTDGSEHKGETLGEKVKGAFHDIKEKIVGKN